LIFRRNGDSAYTIAFVSDTIAFVSGSTVLKFGSRLFRAGKARFLDVLPPPNRLRIPLHFLVRSGPRGAFRFAVRTPMGSPKSCGKSWPDRAAAPSRDLLAKYGGRRSSPQHDITRMERCRRGSCRHGSDPMIAETRQGRNRHRS